MERRQPDVSDSGETQLEMPLLEDIGAELDDFLLLNLLAIDDEARDLLRLVLGRHLQHFPVFAEAAGYVIEKMIENNIENRVMKDTLLQKELRASISRDAIHFDSPDQRMFLNTVIEILDDEKPPSWLVVAASARQFNQWQSSVLCQRLEIQIKFALSDRSLLHGTYNPSAISEILRDMIQSFIRRDMLTDATRYFTILTAFTENLSKTKVLKSIIEDIAAIFRQLMGHLEAKEEKSPNTETGQTKSDVFAANISYLRLLNVRRDGEPLYRVAHVDVNGILRKTRQLLDDTFAMLPDTKPRGRHFTFCERLQTELRGSGSNKRADIEPAYTRRRERTTEPPSRPSTTPSSTQSAPPTVPLQRSPQTSKGSNTTAHSASASPTNPLSRLSGLLAGFVSQKTIEGCREFYEWNPELVGEDLTLLPAIASQYLNQGRRDLSLRALERYLMLREASSAPEGGMKWMKSLLISTRKQDLLKQRCEIGIKEFERRLSVPTSPLSSSGTIIMGPGQSDRSNRENIIQHTERPAYQGQAGWYI